jgi:hypothetical protein
VSDVLANDFAWSQSRDRTYRECLRQYYYSYYGHWGGWEGDADPETREVWILKQVQTPAMWVGDLVHRTAEFALRFARQNRTIPPADILIRRLDSAMREEFRASRDDLMRKSGQKATRLFAHEFGQKMPDGEWKLLHRRAIEAVRTFTGSPLLAEILGVPPDRWMPIEKFEHFTLDGIRVNVKLDFAYLDGDSLRIVDWKTGSQPYRGDTIQLAGYALFANQRWRIPVDRIFTTEVNLVRNEVNEGTVSPDALESAAGYIRDSARSMLGKLEDPDRNMAKKERFKRVEELRTCRRCNFQRVCLGGKAEDVLTVRSDHAGL